MSMLLLIRRAADARSVIKTANEFVRHYRRRHTAAPREADEVLGIWRCEELDGDVPAWSLFDRELGAGAGDGVLTGARPSRLGSRAAPIGITESFSLSGLWTLCWIDDTLLLAADSSAVRRRRTLDALVRTASSSLSPGDPGTFFPVFGASEARDSIDETVCRLQGRYPRLIDGTWFVDDWERGIVSATGADV